MKPNFDLLPGHDDPRWDNYHPAGAGVSKAYWLYWSPVNNDWIQGRTLTYALGGLTGFLYEYHESSNEWLRVVPIPFPLVQGMLFSL
jgi:hypothetical protein